MPLYRKTRFRCSCGHEYPGNSRRRKCPECGGARKPKTYPKHTAALKQPREAFVAANGGFDGCWVCRELGEERPGPLCRDHEHRGAGTPRGLLCRWHNRCLGPRYTPELTAALAKYLNRDTARTKPRMSVRSNS